MELTASTQDKIASKLDDSRTKDSAEYITAWTGTQIKDFQADLQSGVVLCNLANALSKTYSLGGQVITKISTLATPFKQRENIESFLQGIEKLGIKRQDSFMVVDLFEGKNLTAVVDTIQALKRKYPVK